MIPRAAHLETLSEPPLAQEHGELWAPSELMAGAV